MSWTVVQYINRVHTVTHGPADMAHEWHIMHPPLVRCCLGCWPEWEESQGQPRMMSSQPVRLSRPWIFIRCWCCLCVDRRWELSDEGRGEDDWRQDARQFYRSTRHCAHCLHDATGNILTQDCAVTGRICHIALASVYLLRCYALWNVTVRDSASPGGMFHSVSAPCGSAAVSKCVSV